MRQGHDSFRRAALALVGVEEGIACAGTPLEKATYRVGNKAFLFLGNKGDRYDAMLKLDASLDEALRLAAASPASYRVGSTGWVTATFAAAEVPPTGVIERWIAESHAVMSHAGRGARKSLKATSTPAEKTSAQETAKPKSKSKTTAKSKATVKPKATANAKGTAKTKTGSVRS
ncbi:MAG: MmcQ/YjbR family DNA-binding protein [Myxococcales bacterium]|nr:MmcQ/YjbR family DNA-binding protein [Myxococcales bacterium]